MAESRRYSRRWPQGPANTSGTLMVIHKVAKSLESASEDSFTPAQKRQQIPQTTKIILPNHATG